MEDLFLSELTFQHVCALFEVIEKIVQKKVGMSKI